MSRYDWMAKALCAQVDPDLFHAQNAPNSKQVRDICAACPVRRQCAEHAQQVEGDVTRSYRHGVWAGESPNARAERKNDKRIGHRQYDDDIRRLTTQGLSAYRIAQELGCSARTVARARDRLRTEATNYQAAA